MKIVFSLGTLVKKYETMKGSYEKDQDYLAAITKNAIWIKEIKNKKNNIIQASNLNEENLVNLTIYQFDLEYNFLQRIEADSANIFSLFFQNMYEFISRFSIGLNTKKIIHINDIILITASN